MAEWLHLAPPPFASTQMVGVYALRNYQERVVDSALARAGEAIRYRDITPPFCPPDPLNALVEAVLADQGLGAFVHGQRGRGLLLRKQVLRALVGLVQERGRTPVAWRAAQVAEEITQHVRPMPSSARTLLSALRDRRPTRAVVDPYALDITPSGKPRLMIGSEVLRFSKGGGRAFTPTSAEGKLLIALARGTDLPHTRATARSHVRTALRRLNADLHLVEAGEEMRLSHAVPIGERLRAYLER